MKFPTNSRLSLLGGNPVCHPYTSILQQSVHIAWIGLWDMAISRHQWCMWEFSLALNACIMKTEQYPISIYWHCRQICYIPVQVMLDYWNEDAVTTSSDGSGDLRSYSLKILVMVRNHTSIKWLRSGDCILITLRDTYISCLHVLISGGILLVPDLHFSISNCSLWLLNLKFFSLHFYI